VRVRVRVCHACVRACNLCACLVCASARAVWCAALFYACMASPPPVSMRLRAPARARRERDERGRGRRTRRASRAAQALCTREASEQLMLECFRVHLAARRSTGHRL